MNREPADNETLVLSLEELSLESKLDELKGLFTNKLPGFITDIQSRFNLFKEFKKEKNIPKGILRDKYKIALKYIDSLDFLLYGDRYVSVPEDFVGNISEYINELNVIYKDYPKYIINIIYEYNLILAKFITNKEAKYSLQDHTRLFNLSKDQRNNVLSKIKVYMPKDTGKTKGRLRDILHNWKELETVVIDASTLNQRIIDTDLNSITSNLNDSIIKLNIILDQLNTNDINKVSQEAAINISKGAFEIGKLVEQFTIIYNDARIAVYTIEKLLDDIIKRN